MFFRVSAGVLAVLVSCSAQLHGQTGTALVRRVASLNGTVEGSLQQATAASVTLNSGSVITADLFVPGTPSVVFSSSSTFGGTFAGSGSPSPTNHTITLNSGARLGALRTRTDAGMLPSVAAPVAPLGTRSLSITSSSQSTGDFATLRNLTLNTNVGIVPVPAGIYGDFSANSGSGFTLGIAGTTTPTIYAFQRLTLNSGSTLNIVGPVTITVANTMILNASSGNSNHPDWLTLKIASGGLTLNTSILFYGSVIAPNGTVTLNSNSRLIGKLTADSLTLNGGLLRVIGTTTSNKPPTVSLTTPLNNAVLTAHTSVLLTATASDTDGSITKVEFLNGPALLGTSATPPYSINWTPTVPGNYHLSARATDNSGQISTLSVVPVSVLASLPLVVDFENAEDFILGKLNGQRGWTVTQGEAYVVASPLAASGFNHAVLAAGAPITELGYEVGNKSTPPSPVSFADFQTQPVAGASTADGTLFDTDAARITFVREGALGRYYVLNGDGAGAGLWQAAGPSIALTAEGVATTWQRITIRLDYTTKKWDCYIAGVPVATGLAFRLSSASYFSWFGLKGHATSATRFDSLYAGAENPLFEDFDRDGLSDIWERAHGLDPTRDDRAADLDHDGLSNLQELLLGTNPAHADTDGDGLSDGDEVAAGLDPRNQDTDSDGLPDGWELRNGLNPKQNDALLDLDGDGVSNLAEYQNGTSAKDYYNGVIPTLTALVESDGALGPRDSLRMRVTSPDGTPMVNAPVIFQAKTSRHRLSDQPRGPGRESIEARTDSQGIAHVFIRPLNN